MYMIESKRGAIIGMLFALFSCIGTTLNYFLDDRLNRAEVLFPGVACFLIAVCFGSALHKSNAADNKSKLQDFKWLKTIHN